MSLAAQPFSAFNFEVRIRPEGDNAPLAGAAFAECDGLEMTMEVKTIRQGGDNARQVRLAGPASFGNLTLKRGMTEGFDLWNWFTRTLADPALRADVEVALLTPQRAEVLVFHLARCLPVKLKAPPLNAREGVVAIEELQLAFETLSLAPAPPAAGA